MDISDFDLYVIAVVLLATSVSMRVNNYLIVKSWRQEVAKERRKLYVDGEKVGFDKGYEAAKNDARFTLRQDFIRFLKQQVKIMEGEE